jgi:hypothetical protein
LFGVFIIGIQLGVSPRDVVRGQQEAQRCIAFSACASRKTFFRSIKKCVSAIFKIFLLPLIYLTK